MDNKRSSTYTTLIEGVMLHKGKLAEAKPPTRQNKLRWNVLLEDLRFLASVALAHFIVWRTLRRKYRENAARRREFTVLRGAGVLVQPEPHVLRGSDWRANAVANGNRNFRTER
jgi:hypothetical protein